MSERLTATIDEHSDEVDGVLLVLENPVPDEIPLILSVGGLLAARGGSTSHAAVAIHGMEDRVCSAVLGVAELRVSPGEARLQSAGSETEHIVHAGDVISIHGQTGEVFVGSRQILSAETDEDCCIKKTPHRRGSPLPECACNQDFSC